jgi:hypothetical protein
VFYVEIKSKKKWGENKQICVYYNTIFKVVQYNTKYINNVRVKGGKTKDSRKKSRKLIKKKIKIKDEKKKD